MTKMNQTEKHQSWIQTFICTYAITREKFGKDQLMEKMASDVERKEDHDFLFYVSNKPANLVSPEFPLII